MWRSFVNFINEKTNDTNFIDNLSLKYVSSFFFLSLDLAPFSPFLVDNKLRIAGTVTELEEVIRIDWGKGGEVEQQIVNDGKCSIHFE